MKPTVYYRMIKGSLTVGSFPLVEVYSHPRFKDGTPVITSKIIAVVPDTGGFETINSFYKVKD